MRASPARNFLDGSDAAVGTTAVPDGTRPAVSAAFVRGRFAIAALLPTGGQWIELDVGGHKHLCHPFWWSLRTDHEATDGRFIIEGTGVPGCYGLPRPCLDTGPERDDDPQTEVSDSPDED